MDEFKFPDEKKDDKKTTEDKVEFEVEVADTPEIEVVDDTPPADRGRTPMKEPPADVTDEELNQYSEGVKKRIQHFSKGYHEERRAKEAAQREKEEAIRIAQQLFEENKKLQSTQGQTQQALLDQAKKVASSEVEEAKRKLRAAHEAGDTDAFVTAQEELTAAKIKSERVNNFKPAPVQQQKSVVQPAPQTPQVPKPDADAVAWQEANPWFGTNLRMSAVAMEIHKELADSGTKVGSKEYYDKIDAEMRETFPNAFPSEKPSKVKSAVVAPATRSTAPKKIVLTQTQVALAKRFGLTNEQYARAVAEEMRKQNG